MKPNRQLIIQKRRRSVAALHLRGYTYREIHAALPKVIVDGSPEIDLRKNKHWSIATIHDDVMKLTEEWKKVAVSDIADFKGKLLAELDQIKLHCWNEKDMKHLLEAVHQQRVMLGADAPKRTELGGIPGGAPIPTQSTSLLDGIDLAKLEPSELEALERALSAIDGLRAASSRESTPKPP